MNITETYCSILWFVGIAPKVQELLRLNHTNLSQLSNSEWNFMKLETIMYCNQLQLCMACSLVWSSNQTCFGPFRWMVINEKQRKTELTNN